MKEDISVSEYRKLLVGLSGDTPLGYAVSVRSETDRERINNMTAQEKRIRSEWQRFRSKSKNKPEQFTISVAELQRLSKSLAGVK